MAEDDPFLFEVMTALTFRKIEVMLNGMVERERATSRERLLMLMNSWGGERRILLHVVKRVGR